jgi:transposase InsO family protein
MVEETFAPGMTVSLVARQWHRSRRRSPNCRLRLPARPRHPQAPGAGRGFKAAQSQAGLSGDEGRWCRHDGRIAVDERNRRWCSDGFEIGYDNGERVRVAFALDCCDWEAMSFLATTGGISGDDVRDLMVAASSIAPAGSIACRLPSMAVR